MSLNFLKNETKDKIESIGKNVQSLIDSEFQKVNNKPKEDSPLNQAGMQDGFKIIWSNNEPPAF